MSQRDLNDKPSEDGFWIKASASIAANIVSALLASGIIAVLVAGFVAFSRLTSRNAAAFRLLLAAALLGALMSLVSLLILALYGRKAVTVGGRTARQVAELRQDTASQIAVLSRELAGKIDALDRQFPSIDWSFDAAEHDRSVYERMRKVVENDDTMEFKVLTVFRDARSEEVSRPQRSAIQRYYQSLEQALLTRRGFVYERLVVLRPAIGRKRSAAELMSALLLARPEFVEHSQWLLRPRRLALGARSDLRFYGDTGRLFDIAFAVALDEQRRPISLLLEIGTTRPGSGPDRSEHPLLGLLVVDRPSPQLAEAFLFDHQSLRTESMAVDHIPDETVRDILGLD
jgi:hypothetical protein